MHRNQIEITSNVSKEPVIVQFQLQTLPVNARQNQYLKLSMDDHMTRH